MKNLVELTLAVLILVPFFSALPRELVDTLGAAGTIVSSPDGSEWTTEDSGTVVVPLVPWSMAGIYMSGTLGVAALDYAPWAFMCYLGILFALVCGYSGIGIAPRIREDETLPGS